MGPCGSDQVNSHVAFLVIFDVSNVRRECLLCLRLLPLTMSAGTMRSATNGHVKLCTESWLAEIDQIGAAQRKSAWPGRTRRRTFPGAQPFAMRTLGTGSRTIEPIAKPMSTFAGHLLMFDPVQAPPLRHAFESVNAAILKADSGLRHPILDRARNQDFAGTRFRGDARADVKRETDRQPHSL